jgi:D-alanyl-D-alanine carboxypeptidase
MIVSSLRLGGLRALGGIAAASFALCLAPVFDTAAFAKPKSAAHRAPQPVRHIQTPFIAIDVPSGRVIEQRDATRIWYPASITKLMTVYVTLQAVRQGRLAMDTPLVVSARAARMKPSKMGFAPGSQVTLDNALKMLMVKSANDMAVTIAEGVSGSVEAFADEMNQAASTLGMRESHFVNPNGLPDPDHVSSARDMAVLGRALLLRFPEHADLFNIGAMKLGEQVIPTHNGMLGRYPGADGMKTGYTCPAGFNLVASATREGRKVIVVVLGDPSARRRTAHAANLFDHAFAAGQLGASATDLPTQAGAPPDMRGEICVHRSKAALLAAETDETNAPVSAGDGSAPQPSNGEIIAALPRPIYQPIEVFVGPAPGYTGPVAGPRPANTPIGVIAYAAPEKAATALPLRPDPAALPMRRGKATKHSAAKNEKAAQAHKKPAATKAAAAASKGKAAAK